MSQLKERRHRRVQALQLRFVTFCVWLIVGTASCQQSDPTDRPASLPNPVGQGWPSVGMAWVIFPSDTVLAEVASDAESRYRGLRFRQSLPEGTGMVFLFVQPAPQAFTMADTYVPLDIAFVRTDMTIGEIIPMMPSVEGPYETSVEALLAIEVPQGWFAAHGIGVGTSVELELGGTPSDSR